MKKAIAFLLIALLTLSFSSEKKEHVPPQNLTFLIFPPEK